MQTMNTRTAIHGLTFNNSRSESTADMATRWES